MSRPTFVVPDGFAAGQTVTLGEAEAHHMRVRRLEGGERVVLLDGAGRRGEGVLLRVAKRNASVEVNEVVDLPPPAPVHLLVPVADRDRMLWLAEKCAELAITSWRPVLFKHSRSVNPRGEGTTFQQKVAARMAGALEQSQGAWLPICYPEGPLDRALAAVPTARRIVLDGGGLPLNALLAPIPPDEEIVIAVGPEGGLEAAELDAFRAAGFAVASLGETILRFETAAIVAAGAARVHQSAHPVSPERGESIDG